MELIPAVMLRPVVACIVAAEVLLALNLLTATGTRITGVLVFTLLGVFILTLTASRLRGNKRLVCGCFADFEHKQSVAYLITRNVLLCATALPLLLVSEIYVPAWGMFEWTLAICTIAGVALAWQGLVEIGQIVRLHNAEATAIDAELQAMV